MNTEIRCSIEHREDASRLSPGRLEGTLLQYDTRASDRAERFATDSLSWPADGIVLNLSHDRKRPILRFVPEVRGSALMVDIDLPDTQDGRDAATLVRNQTLRGLSVEFQAQDERMADGVREIRAAKLLAAGLVDDPSYGGSRVEVRADALRERAKRFRA